MITTMCWILWIPSSDDDGAEPDGPDPVGVDPVLPLGAAVGEVEPQLTTSDDAPIRTTAACNDRRMLASMAHSQHLPASSRTLADRVRNV
jgi:hypothetical protein